MAPGCEPFESSVSQSVCQSVSQKKGARTNNKVGRNEHRLIEQKTAQNFPSTERTTTDQRSHMWLVYSSLACPAGQLIRNQAKQQLDVGQSDDGGQM